MPPRSKPVTPTAPVAPPVDANTPKEVVAPVEKKPKEPKEVKPIVYAEPIENLDKVIYSSVSVVVCGTPEQHGVNEELVTKIQESFKLLGVDNLIGYAPSITAVDAQALIGWEVETKDGPKFKDDWVVKDYYGKRVRLHKNIRNRPIYQTNIDSLSQDLLMGRWELNGETLIVSDTGNVLDGQHTLIALIIAQQKLNDQKDEEGNLKWAKHWPDLIVKMPKIIVYGVKGTDNVVNTMNTCRPRSFADVLYRSSYFINLKQKSTDGLDRETAAKVTDHAIREVWQRTGLYMDGYSSKRTNSEGIAWIESHGGMDGKFMECVKHILEEDTHGHISSYIQCGKAVCLMWLGSCGKSDEEKYYSLRNEDNDAEAYMSLKWHNWKFAKQFWTDFGDREPDKEVETKDGKVVTRGKSRGPLKALTDLLDEMNKSDEPMVREKDFLIARAWSLWLEEKPVTASIRIKDTDYGDADKVTGVRHLKKANHKRFGNLDLGMDRIKITKAKETVSPEEQAKLNAEIKKLQDLSLEQLKKTEDDKELTVTSDKLGSVKPQSQRDSEALHTANPDIPVILVKTHSGKCEAWGPYVQSLGKLLGVEVYQHPNDSHFLKLDVDDWGAISDKVTDAGYAIAMGERIEGVLQVIMTSLPSSPKNGAGQKK